MILGGLVIFTLKTIFLQLEAVNSLSVSIGVPFSKNLPEEYFLNIL